MLDVCLLGTSGMMPLPNRYLTSLLVRINGKMLLIDCGEGTQVSAKILGWGFKNIDIICFTHFHADHIAGLPGFLLTMGNSGREDDLIIIGPKGLINIYQGISSIFPELPFKVILKEINLTEEYFESEEIRIGDFSIKAMLMEHSIPCYSYTIELKRKGKFLLEKAEKLNIPKNLWGKLQSGENVFFENRIYTPDLVLGENRKSIKIAYCTDSRPVERIYKFIENSNLFICEGIYGENEKIEGAILKKHMIFSEAANIAKKSNVEELWLTHFSPALTEPELFLENATNIFPNTFIGYDRISKKILFEE